MKKIISSIIFIFVATFFISCEENISSKDVKNRISQTLLPNQATDPVFDAYMDNIDFTNVVGLISIMRYTHHTYYNGQLNTGSSFTVSARTVDNDQQTLLSENYISFNGVGLEEIGEGNYQLSSADMPVNYVVNFGTGTNHITLENRNGQEVLNSDVTIQAPVAISNIIGMQNVSISQDLVTNYTPVADNCIVSASLKKNTTNTDNLKNLPANSVGLLYGYFNNTGTFSILGSDLNYYMNPGLFDLRVKKEEIKILTRTDGKKLAVFVQTIDTKTINLVP